MLLTTLGLGLALMIQQPQASFRAPSAEPTTLFEAFDTYCLRPAGDHIMTWSIAAVGGFQDMDAAERDRFVPWAFARDIRVKTRTVDGIEYRLITSDGAARPVGMDVLEHGSLHHMCWVAARPVSRRAVLRDVGRHLRVRSVRVGESRVFPWIEVDGARRSVHPDVFLDDWHRLIREEDMRQVSVGSTDGWTSLGYLMRRAPNVQPDHRGRY